MKTILKVALLAGGGGTLGYTINNRLRRQEVKWQHISTQQEEIIKKRAQLKQILETSSYVQEPSSNQD